MADIGKTVREIEVIPMTEPAKSPTPAPVQEPAREEEPVTQ